MKNSYRNPLASLALFCTSLLCASAGGEPAIETEESSLTIPEGNTGEVRVRLSEAPSEAVTVDAERISGHASLAPGTVVRFTSTYPESSDEGGTMFDVILFDQDTPKTIAAFLDYMETGGYEDGIAHNLQPGETLSGGLYEVIEGSLQQITDEVVPLPSEGTRSNTRGTLAMQSGSSETNPAAKAWFFNLSDNSEAFDAANPALTVFGQVVDASMEEVIDPIAELPILAIDGNNIPVIETEDGNFPVYLYPLGVAASRSVTFDETNWDQWQSVYISAGRDHNVADEQATVRFSAEEYAAADVQVVNEDPDSVSLVVEPAELVVAEGRTAPVRVKLSHQPEDAVEVRTARTEGDSDITVTDGATLIFTPRNWDVPQEVVVAAATDEDEENGTATLNITVDDLPATEMTVIEADQAFAIAAQAEEASITVSENEYGTFRIRLEEEPPSEMVLRVTRQNGDPDLVIPPAVRVSTVLGSFDAALYERDTPETVENFLNYLRRGAFDNTFFHRSVEDFIIQAGSYTWGVQGATEIPPDPPVVNEPVRSNTRGTLAMAKLSDQPDSATSGWFVNLADNSGNLDIQNEGFTAFGEVLGDGMDVADAIADLPIVNVGGAFTELPVHNWQEGEQVTGNNLVLLPAIEEIDTAELRFTPENWDTYQSVWLSALDDPDTASGEATFTVEWIAGDRALDPLELQAHEGAEQYWTISLETAGGAGSTSPTDEVRFDTSRTSPLSVSASTGDGFAFSHWTLEPEGTITWPRSPQTGIVPTADSTLAAHVAEDNDGDGIPDAWEQEHGLETTADDAHNDNDGDGWTNHAEYRRGTDPNRHVLTLEAGWNTVSTGSAEGADILQAIQADDAVSELIWTQNNGLMAKADTIEAGRAYWVNSSAPTEIEFPAEPGSTADADSYEIALSKGWNFIGFIVAPLNMDARQLVSSNPTIYGSIWTWRNGKYHRADTLDAGRGHWIFTTEATTLTIPKF